MIKTDVVILGAGLSGLTTAYFLRGFGKEVTILEPRQRIGGRIHTVWNQGNASMEMGATWVHRPHTNLLSLLKELKIETFDQVIGNEVIYEQNSLSPFQYVNIPPNNDPSLRVRGGTSKILDALSELIPEKNIILEEKANSIKHEDGKLKLEGVKNDYLPDLVISTLPPNLLINTIKFDPELPILLKEIAQRTHTWMGDSIKVGFNFQKPFWRKDNRKGTIFCNSGPITEMYDHSNFHDDKYSLKGFLDNALGNLTEEARKQMALNQLRKYYGSDVDKFISYHEYVWQNDPFTYIPNEGYVNPHQNNGHSCYQETYLSNRFILSGTETSKVYPGYMEGAVYSGMKAAEAVKSFYRK